MENLRQTGRFSGYDLEPFPQSNPKVSSSMSNILLALEEAGSNRPEWKPIKVQVQEGTNFIEGLTTPQEMESTYAKPCLKDDKLKGIVNLKAISRSVFKIWLTWKYISSISRRWMGTNKKGYGITFQVFINPYDFWKMVKVNMLKKIILY